MVDVLNKKKKHTKKTVFCSFKWIISNAPINIHTTTIQPDWFTHQSERKKGVWIDRQEEDREKVKTRQRATNAWAAPWVHVECHGCSRYGGCSPGTGRGLLERTAPAAGVCRRAVEGRTGPPGCTFPAAPWQRDYTPLPAASSRETTKSPLLL